MTFPAHVQNGVSLMKTCFPAMTILPVLLVLAGCSGEPAATDTPPSDTVESEHEHAHPTEGPHHGHLVELGDEEYHAEVVHDGESVTVYMFDGHVENAAPIDAAEITINLTHDGRPEQFALTASPDVADPDGKSSRFVSTDAELAKHLDEEASKPQLSVIIGGQPFMGRIEHSHDEHDHGHNHD